MEELARVAWPLPRAALDGEFVTLHPLSRGQLPLL